MSAETICVQMLAKLMQENSDFFLLDVRSIEEHHNFNLGGVLIPLPELSARIHEIPANKPIVVYCRSGHRSHLAQVLLQQAGYPDVKNLTGGVLAWQLNG